MASIPRALGTWFNTSRLHFELGDRTPAEVEDDHYRDLGGATAA